MPTHSFNYLDPDTYYFDHACQNLRPSPVIESVLEYYTKYNACSGRVNHHWGKTVDKLVDETRAKILNFLGKSAFEYSVVFTLNTTYGINLILNSLDYTDIKSIITTEKEHNSVLLPAMSMAKEHGKELIMLKRNSEGMLNLKTLLHKDNSLVILNTTSNIDGESVLEIEDLITICKKQNSLVFLDACQSLGSHYFDFYDMDFDCLFASGHKMYGPSIGFIVIKKDLINALNQTWVGGGTVKNVSKQGYELIDQKQNLHARLEFGLQDYAGICGLNTAFDWLGNYQINKEYTNIEYKSNILDKLSNRIFASGISQEAVYYLDSLSELLFSQLKIFEKTGLLTMLNTKPSNILSFFANTISSEEITEKLSKSGILCRSGYMCTHYYIKEVLKMPPITRISLGLHNTPQDIAHLLAVLQDILR